MSHSAQGAGWRAGGADNPNWPNDVGYQNLRIVADRLLETTRVEYVDEGVLRVMNPPGIEHRRIVRSIVDDAKRTFYTGAIAVNWATDENYQWDLPDGSDRFYIPDLVFIHPDATTAEEERAAIALVVDVTSPTSPDTVLKNHSAPFRPAETFTEQDHISGSGGLPSCTLPPFPGRRAKPLVTWAGTRGRFPALG